MKRCPSCAEEIQDAAMVCRYCNRDLPAAAGPRKPSSGRKLGGLWLMAGGLWLVVILATRAPDKPAPVHVSAKPAATAPTPPPAHIPEPLSPLERRVKEFGNMPTDPTLIALVSRKPDGTCTGPENPIFHDRFCGPGDQLPWVNASRIYADYFETGTIDDADSVYQPFTFVITGKASAKGPVPVRLDRLFKFPDFGACADRPCSAYLTIDGKVQALFGSDDIDEVAPIRLDRKVAIACLIVGANTAATHVLGVNCSRMLPETF